MCTKQGFWLQLAPEYKSLDVRTTLRRMLKDDLGLFPYRIQIKQQLTADDKRRRLVMALALMDEIESNRTFLANLITTDEIHFHLDSHVNSKNNFY